MNNSDYQTGDPSIISQIGKYSVKVTGSANDWYAGGMGTYLAKKGQDLGKYNAIQMDMFGNGPGSGTLKIELVDDDKGNWQIEQDSKGEPLYDDMFVYNETVDWRGWKGSAYLSATSPWIIPEKAMACLMFARERPRRTSSDAVHFHRVQEGGTAGFRLRQCFAGKEIVAAI